MTQLDLGSLSKNLSSGVISNQEFTDGVLLRLGSIESFKDRIAIFRSLSPNEQDIVNIALGSSGRGDIQWTPFIIGGEIDADTVATMRSRIKEIISEMSPSQE